MASIEKRGKGYRISVSCGRNVSGKQIIEKTTFIPDPLMTPRQQEKALNLFALEFEQKIKSGKYYNGEKMLFKNFTEKWLKEYAKEQLEDTSYATYEIFLHNNILPELGHFPIGKITPMHLNDFYNRQIKNDARKDGRKGGYSSSSVKKMHVILSSVFSTAVNWQLIDENPCNKVKPPKMNQSNSDIKYFTLEQVKDFLNMLEIDCKIPTQFRVFFHIALFGGMRRGEILGLTWDDINFMENTVHINKSVYYTNREVKVKKPKTKSSIRNIVLPEFVMMLIRKYKKEYYENKLRFGEMWTVDENGKPYNWLFIQKDGKLMHPSTPYSTFKDIVEKHNRMVKEEDRKLPQITLHGLRHTHSTLLIAENVDIKTVSARLGHATTSTTLNIYTHAIKARDTVVADKLDSLFSTKQASTTNRL